MVESIACREATWIKRLFRDAMLKIPRPRVAALLRTHSLLNEAKRRSMGSVFLASEITHREAFEGAPVTGAVVNHRSMW